MVSLYYHDYFIVNINGLIKVVSEINAVLEYGIISPFIFFVSDIPEIPNIGKFLKDTTEGEINQDFVLKQATDLGRYTID